jgi:hypothetical protein
MISTAGKRDWLRFNREWSSEGLATSVTGG